jgi:hypothetical protein
MRHDELAAMVPVLQLLVAEKSFPAVVVLVGLRVKVSG